MDGLRKRFAYAAVSYSDIPTNDGRRIWLGWMSNWRYPFAMPTDGMEREHVDPAGAAA